MPLQASRIAYALVWLITVAGLLAFTDGATTTNPASRFATAKSLVDRDTFEISQSRFDTIDKVRIDGRRFPAPDQRGRPKAPPIHETPRPPYDRISPE